MVTERWPSGGIATVDLAHIFERDGRAANAKGMATGTCSGLGQASVKRRLDLHGAVNIVSTMAKVHSAFMRRARLDVLMPQTT